MRRWWWGVLGVGVGAVLLVAAATRLLLFQLLLFAGETKSLRRALVVTVARHVFVVAKPLFGLFSQGKSAMVFLKWCKNPASASLREWLSW